jgi:hypothetical protein
MVYLSTDKKAHLREHMDVTYQKEVEAKMKEHRHNAILVISLHQTALHSTFSMILFSSSYTQGV